MKLIYIIKVILESNYLKSVFKIEGKIKINKINEADIDNIDRNYYSQTYSIEHNSNIKNIMLSTLGIENVKICDSNNNEISNINNVNTFKVLIPRVSVTEDYVEDNDDWTTITYSKEIQLDKLPKTGC